MQNLLWKFTVLTGVIGASCFVVWQAHDALQDVSAEPTAVEEFTSLDDGQDVAPDEFQTASDPSPLKDQLEPLPQLAEPVPQPSEPEPTLAILSQAETEEPEPEPASLNPEVKTAALPEPDSTPSPRLGSSYYFPSGKSNSEQAAPSAGGPRGFPSDGPEMTVALAPQQAESTEPDADEQENSARPFMALAQSNSTSPAQPAKFTPAPPQQTEQAETSQPASTPLEPALPEPEPLNNAVLPPQSEATVSRTSGSSPEDKDPVTLFGPAHRTAPTTASQPPLPQTAAIEQPVSDERPVDDEQPGLMKLPPSHPGPVLLTPKTNESSFEPMATVAESSGGVIQAAAEESASTDSQPRALPALTPVQDSARNVDRLEPAAVEVLPTMPAKTGERSSSPALDNPFAFSETKREEAPKDPAPQQMEPVMPSGFGFEETPKSTAPEARPNPFIPLTDREQPESQEPPAKARALPTLDFSNPAEEVTPVGNPSPAADAAPQQPEPIPFPPLETAPAMAPPTDPFTGGAPSVSESPKEAPEPTPPPATGGEEVLPTIIPRGSSLPVGNDSFSTVKPEEKKPSPADDAVVPSGGVFPLEPANDPPPKTPQSLPPGKADEGTPTPEPQPKPAESQPFPLQLGGSSMTIEPKPLPKPNDPPSDRMATTDSELRGNGEFDPAAPSGPQSPELKIEKIVPPEAVIGESLIYAINIRNVGGSVARKVVVEDQIPRGTKLEGTIPQAVLTEGKLVWELGTIPPGEERKIQLKVIPTEPGQIGSVATVSFAAAVSASIRITAPKLSVQMGGPSEAILGDKISYRFTVTNSGEGDGKGVFIRAILPEGLKHPGGNDIEYEVGTLPSGESRSIDLTLSAEDTGVFAPQAIVSIDGKEYDKTQANIRIIRSRLEVARTGPVRRFVGRTAEYVNEVTNQSERPISNAIVTEVVPQGIELAGMPVGGHWDPAKRTISWSIPKLEPGESVKLKSQLVPSTTGVHAGRVSVRDAAGNEAELETSLDVKGFADLDLDLSSPNQTVVIGEQVSLRLTLKNDGTASASDVKTTFEIPDGLQFVSAKGPVRYETLGKTVQFASLNELPVDAEQSFDVVLVAAEECTTKVRVSLESADYSEPVVTEQAVRIIDESP